MADPLNDKIVAALDGVAGSPGLIWDVLPPLYTEKQWCERLCVEYPSATAAWGALKAAGFAPTGDYLPAPPLDWLYDQQTVLRFKDDLDRGLLLARRKRS